MAKIGLLPLYIALYDESSPQYRPVMEQFRDKICSLLAEQGAEVITSDICRLEDEFKAAVKSFEDAQCDVMVTLHLAYSPSLESAKVLAETKLPIIVLDTTQEFAFDSESNSVIMLNHGIHGVMDMCNLLRRNGKAFDVFAGFYEGTDLIKNVVARANVIANAAKIAKKMSSARIGIVGKPFKGMGDFAIPYEDLKNDLGMTIVDICPESFADICNGISEEDIRAEMKKDRDSFKSLDNFTETAHYETAKTSLAVRKWLAEEKLDGFTVNFLETGKDKPLKTMPFMEACKAMARGTGYAGEGDVMTAGFVSALLSVYPGATFAEVFCPDWKGNTLFFSHMGEFNLAIAKDVLMQNKDFPYTDAENPVFISGNMKGGNVVYADLAKTQNGYMLILAPGKMVDVEKNNFSSAVSGWFAPDVTIDKFLAQYGELGGTHHGALVYDGDVETLEAFAKLCGFDCAVIK